MSITTTGTIADTRTTDARYAVGTTASGTLTVNAGSVLTIDSLSGYEAKLRASGGLTAGVTGTVTIDGAGSMVVLNSGGSTTDGASVAIGRFGDGVMKLTNGATLYIEDVTGTSAGSAYDGGESLQIGRDGYTGSVSVDASAVHIKGTGAYVNIGRNGGSGKAYFTNGATLVLENSTNTQYDEAGITVGRDAGSVGTLSFKDSSATLTSGTASQAFMNVGRSAANAQGALLADNSQVTLTGGSMGAYINLGRDGSGTAMITRGSTVTLQSSAASSNSTTISVGRADTAGGVGALTVDASTVTLAQAATYAGLYIGMNYGATGASGTVSLRNAATVNVSGATGSYVTVGLLGGGAAAGVTGGTGLLQLATGATLNITPTGGSAAANLNVGYGAGATGTLIADAATINIAGSFAGFYNGVSNGSGATTLRNGASLTIYSTYTGGQSLSSLTVGRGSFTMTASTLSMRAAGATSGGGAVGVQQTGGGTATFSATGSAISGVNTLNVGSGGAGAATIAGGSFGLVSNVSNNSYIAATILVGGTGGAGALTLSGGAAMSVDQFANLMIAQDYSSAPVNPTTGTVTVNGATLSLASASAASHGSIWIGMGSKSTGVLNILGATGAVSGVSGVTLGSNGGNGALLIDAGRLNLSGAGYAASVTVGGYGAASRGALTIRNRGILAADATGANLTIGQYGGGSGAVSVLSGGSIDLGVASTATTYNSISIGNSSTGSGTAMLLISGAGSTVSRVQSVSVYGPSAGAGTLRVEAGGALTAGNVYIGTGGRLDGSGGVVNGAVSINLGGLLGDAGGAVQTMTVNGAMSLSSGSTTVLDVAATTNDRYVVSGSLSASGYLGSPVNILVNPASGVTFATGARRVFFDMQPTALVSLSSLNVSVQGQNADFGYFFGSFADTRDVGLLALNSGATGGAAALNFGAASTLSATVTYDSSAGTGSVSGGAIGSGVIRNVDVIYGTGVADTITITGSVGMRIYGGAGYDWIATGSGADVIDGGAGGDGMSGGAGADSYFVNDASDTVWESVGNGVDTVYVSCSAYTLASGQEIERMRALDAASTTAMSLTGNAFAQIISGNAGDNQIDGGGGNDTLYGQGGNDTYIVSTTQTAVMESVGGGYDQVIASCNYALVGSQEIESLSASGGAYSTAGLRLSGNNFAQTITGDGGANVINGGGGADVMSGLGGADLYYVDNAGDIVHEAAGQGVDTIVSTVSYALGAGESIETLRFTDTTAVTTRSLTGNELGQRLLGDGGANRLDGGDGVDTLYGYGGADTFVFSTALGASNIDSIMGFQVGVDRVELSSPIFAAAGPLGALAANAFTVGTAATTTDQRIVYNSTNGVLYYDADGAGGAAQQAFARIGTGLALTQASFVVA